MKVKKVAFMKATTTPLVQELFDSIFKVNCLVVYPHSSVRNVFDISYFHPISFVLGCVVR